MRNKFMSKIITFYILLLMVIPIVSPTMVYAQAEIPTITSYKEEGGKKIPLDADGDVIEVVGITSDEKGWVRDATGDEVVYYLMDKNYNILETKSSEEMDNIIEARDPTDSGKGQEFEVSEGEKTGSIVISATLPEEIQGKDVVVTMQGNDTTGDYHLYAKNNYELTELIPTGTYTVVDATVQGDTAHTYTANFDDSVAVSENSAANLRIEFEDIKNVGLKQNIDENAGEEFHENRMPLIAKIIIGIAISITLLLLGFGIIVIRDRIRN